MTKLEGNLRRGGTTFITERWTAADALRLVAEHGMTSIAGVPAQIALMLRHPDFDAHDLSLGPVRDRRRRSGHARASPTRRAPASAPHSPTRYSCTEAGIGLGTGFDDPPEDAVVSVGRPHAAVDLAILDDDDAPGRERATVGAVCLRSPAVMARYWRDAARPRPPRSPPTATSAPATSATSTTRAGSGSSGGARRCTSGVATTCTPSRSRPRSRPIPTVGGDRDRIPHRSGDGRGRGRGRREPETRGTRRRSPTSASTPPRGWRAYKLPEGIRVRRRAPLTPAEKLDRRALGALDHRRPDAGVARPLTPDVG